MKRANGVIETVIDMLTGRKRLTFKVEGQPDLVLDTGKIHADVLEHAALHGLKQRVSDAAAIPCDEATGKPASPAEKYGAMKAVVDHYNSGAATWRLTGSEHGERAEGGITLRAVAAVQGVEVGVMRERVKELAEKRGLTTKAVYASLAKSPDVIRKVAELKAAKGGAVDSEAILAELA